MTSHHDPILVLLSFVIAMLASYATLDLTNSLMLARGRAQLAWLGVGALAMGTGIWSMHFIGMLAFHLPDMRISYELKLLIASIAIAVIASMLALFVFTRPRVSRARLLVAGLVMGVAISGMHYTGMAAMRVPARITWSAPLVVLSIVIAVAAAFVALNLAGRVRSNVGHPALLKGAGAAVMGVAIAGMHYTAMSAAHFSPAPLSITHETRLLATAPLAVAVIMSSIMILIVAIGASAASRIIMSRMLQLQREHELGQQLRQSEEYYRALIENASDLIIVMDARANPRYVSPSFWRTLGHRPEDVIDVNLFDLVHADDVGQVRAAFATLLEQPGGFTETTFRARHADGSWRTLRAVGQNLIEHQAVRGIIVTAQDETERRRLEEQFRQSQKMEAVGRLAGGVAHDFNNLLTVIIGNTELLSMDESEAQRALLQEIDEAAQRAAGLTRQLLAFSRRQVLQPNKLQLNDIVRSMHSMIVRLLGEHIEIVLKLSADLPVIRADSGQVEQALLNLAVNARDAMPDGGVLTISTGVVHREEAVDAMHEEVPAGDYVCLEVADTGHGIEADIIGRVFEPFFTTKDLGKGTGLGLPTVYGIMKQSGGYVSVHTEAQQGASFILLFPALPHEQLDTVVMHKTNGAARGDATILLIEDETAVRSFAKRVLQQRGYQVIDAATGEEAIERAAGHDGPIHLIVSDVVLPGMNGREVADRITLTRPGARVLFMSGYTEDEIIHRGVLSSGLSFLQKPFAPAELVSKVSGMLEN
jgi:PAS domain S-box-containing protein